MVLFSPGRLLVYVCVQGWLSCPYQTALLHCWSLEAGIGRLVDWILQRQTGFGPAQTGVEQIIWNKWLGRARARDPSLSQHLSRVQGGSEMPNSLSYSPVCSLFLPENYFCSGF